MLSNGRVDFGMGRGSTPYMVDAFGVDRADRARAGARGDRSGDADVRARSGSPATRASISICRRATCCRGRCSARTRRCGSPPPTFAATSGRARQGVGRDRRHAQQHRRDPRRDPQPIARRSAAADPQGFVGAYANEQVGGFALACCHEDDRIGRDIACAAARWYNGDNDAELNPVRFATAGGVEAVVSKFRNRSNEQLIEDGMAIGGNPDTICRVVEKWAEAGLDQMIFLLQAGRTTHDQVMRSIDLIGEKVIPRFATRQQPRTEPIEAPREIGAWSRRPYRGAVQRGMLDAAASLMAVGARRDVGSRPRRMRRRSSTSRPRTPGGARCRSWSRSTRAISRSRGSTPS